MFDVSNVVSSPLITHPWRHQIIEEFFTPADFEIISAGVNQLLTTLDPNAVYENKTGINIVDAKDILGKECFDILLDSNEKLLDSISAITSNYPNHRRFDSVMSLPKFHILPPNFSLTIHDEAYDKACSVVVYMSELENSGTAIYSKNSLDSIVAKVPWKQNRSLLFCGEQNVTWHSFRSNNNQRVTLNYFIQKNVTAEVEINDNIRKFINQGYLVR